VKITPCHDVIQWNVTKEVDPEPGTEVVFSDFFAICDVVSFLIDVGSIEAYDNIDIEKKVNGDVEYLKAVRKGDISEAKLSN
jgi:hypothetical protein